MDRAVKNWQPSFSLTLFFFLIALGLCFRDEGFSAWGLQASRCGRFSCCAAQALEHGLSGCGTRASVPVAYGILLNQGWNPCPLPWQEESTTGSPGKSFAVICNSPQQVYECYGAPRKTRTRRRRRHRYRYKYSHSIYLIYNYCEKLVHATVDAEKSRI